VGGPCATILGRRGPRPAGGFFQKGGGGPGPADRGGPKHRAQSPPAPGQNASSFGTFPISHPGAFVELKKNHRFSRKPGGKKTGPIEYPPNFPGPREGHLNSGGRWGTAGGKRIPGGAKGVWEMDLPGENGRKRGARIRESRGRKRGADLSAGRGRAGGGGLLRPLRLGTLFRGATVENNSRGGQLLGRLEGGAKRNRERIDWEQMGRASVKECRSSKPTFLRKNGAPQGAPFGAKGPKKTHGARHGAGSRKKNNQRRVKGPFGGRGSFFKNSHAKAPLGKWGNRQALFGDESNPGLALFWFLEGGSC